MSNAIWKYELTVAAEQIVIMPKKAEILTVQVQNGTPQLWAKVNPDFPPEDRLIVTYGTGHKHESITGQYVGTYQVQNGALVFHVFDDTPQEPFMR